MVLKPSRAWLTGMKPLKNSFPQNRETVAETTPFSGVPVLLWRLQRLTYPGPNAVRRKEESDILVERSVRHSGTCSLTGNSSGNSAPQWNFLHHLSPRAVRGGKCKSPLAHRAVTARRNRRKRVFSNTGGDCRACRKTTDRMSEWRGQDCRCLNSWLWGAATTGSRDSATSRGNLVVAASTAGQYDAATSLVQVP